ncbi:uncharacterized protein LOC142535781 [Primulina tabacum]|uniref:uncharacterized protein LOC142535781 n=1 Tax=Primulina tabacum TaxID=48773 RepID=UPI003F591EF2
MSRPSHSPRSVKQQQINESGEDPLSLNLTRETPNQPDPPSNPDGEEGEGEEREQEQEPEEQEEEEEEEGEEQETPQNPLIQMGMNIDVVPPIVDPHVSVSGVTLASPSDNPTPRRGPNKRKKAKPNLRKQRSILRKLESLKVNFNPIPFIPIKILDFSKHEKLLKKLGLWDFVHIDFDRNIRVDLIGQLVVSYDPKLQCGYVDGHRISFIRGDFARAFKLPSKKKANVGGVEAVVLDTEDVSDDSIGFILEFVSDWVLLHEDTWITPNPVMNWLSLIKGGQPEKVDWAGLFRFMVENELKQGDQLGDCYYASHLQYLLKFQRETVFTRQEDLVAEKLEVEAETKGEEKEINEENVMAGSSILEDQGEKSYVVEALSIELTLGQDGGKEVIMQDLEMTDVEMTDVEKCKDDGDGDGDGDGDNDEDYVDDEDREEVGKEQGQWLLRGKNNLGEHFLQPCSMEEGEGFENLEDEDGQGFDNLEDGKEDDAEETEGDGDGQGFDNLEDGKEDDVEETEGDGGDHGFDVFPAVNDLDGEGLTGNFLQAMEANQVAFNSQERLHGPSSVDTTRDDMRCMDPSPSFFNPSGKRVIEHDTDMGHDSLDDSNKRLRINDSWNHKPIDFHTCMEEIQQLVGKTRMLYEEREQALEQVNMNQQILLNELQKRDALMEHLHKSRMEEMQKKDGLIYRLERELYLAESVIDGYRKALKETRKTFAEYRQSVQLTEEPTYKDAGPGGLMLSTTEIEKIRQKQEEYNMNCLLVEQKFKETEEQCMHEFNAYVDKINILDKKLTDVEAAAKELIQSYGTRNVQPTEDKVDEVSTPHPIE